MDPLTVFIVFFSALLSATLLLSLGILMERQKQRKAHLDRIKRLNEECLNQISKGF